MRRVLIAGLALVLALVMLPLGSIGAAAASPTPSPPFGDVASVVYFPQTKHHLQGAFLQYWLDNGGVDVFGYPLTEEFGQNGLTVQYFQRARFELHPNNPAGSQVQLGLLGREATNWRTDGPFTPYPANFTYQNNDDHWYFPQTGHFLSYGFKTFWQQNGGLAIFGYPISEEFQENGVTVQYFERARFEYHPDLAGTPYAVELGLLGSQIGATQHVSFAGIAQRSGSATYPNISTLPAKWIEINLSTQSLTAWDGDMPAHTTLVSTGVADHPTPTGVFYVQTKLRYDDMTGGLAGTSDYYYLPNVPWVMYFYTGGYAIHGTYWHHNFGHVMSHGCVNLPTPDAEWVYQWAPIGTPIWIHY